MQIGQDERDLACVGDLLYSPVCIDSSSTSSAFSESSSALFTSLEAEFWLSACGEPEKMNSLWTLDWSVKSSLKILLGKMSTSPSFPNLSLDLNLSRYTTHSKANSCISLKSCTLFMRSFPEKFLKSYKSLFPSWKFHMLFVVAVIPLIQIYTLI